MFLDCLRLRPQLGGHQLAGRDVVAAAVLAQIEDQAIGVADQGERGLELGARQVPGIEAGEPDVADIALQQPHLPHAGVDGAAFGPPRRQPVLASGVATAWALEVEVPVMDVEVTVEPGHERLGVAAALAVAPRLRPVSDVPGDLPALGDVEIVTLDHVGGSPKSLGLFRAGRAERGGQQQTGDHHEVLTR